MSSTRSNHRTPERHRVCLRVAAANHRGQPDKAQEAQRRFARRTRRTHQMHEGPRVLVERSAAFAMRVPFAWLASIGIVSDATVPSTVRTRTSIPTARTCGDATQTKRRPRGEHAGCATASSFAGDKSARTRTPRRSRTHRRVWCAARPAARASPRANAFATSVVVRASHHWEGRRARLNSESS